MDKVIRSDVLWRAWFVVRRNDGAPGVGKVTLAAVEEYGAARLLGELATELRERRYRPLPARRVLITKPGSAEMRPLSIPAVRDRLDDPDEAICTTQGRPLSPAGSLPTTKVGTIDKKALREDIAQRLTVPQPEGLAT